MVKRCPISLLKNCLVDECTTRSGSRVVIDHAQVRNEGLIRVHLSFLRAGFVKYVSIENVLPALLEISMTEQDFLHGSNVELFWTRAGVETHFGFWPIM